jgi:DnaK suppressor protein
MHVVPPGSVSWARAARRARLAPFRAELEAMRRQRTEQVARARAGDQQAPRSGSVRRPASPLEIAESALAEIDAALRRIEDGSYGTCRRCREQIPAARLNALPHGSHCARCQRASDLGQP